MTGTVPTLSMVFMAVSILIGFGLPLAMFLYFRLKKKADILPFFVGCAVMLLFALVLEAMVHRVILGSSVGGKIQNNVWLYAVYGGLMAGLFEETGRFLAFKTVLKKHQHRDVNALMYGAGHGGIEAVVLLGITMINNLTYSVIINAGSTEALLAPLTGDLKAQVQSAIQALCTTPAHHFLLGGVERIFAVALQISLSVLVWFAAKRPGKRCLFPAAIGLHALVDAATVILSGKCGNLILVEVGVGVFALLYVLIAKLVWKANAQKEAPADAN